MTAQSPRGIQPEDLFRIAMVGDVAVSPDGAAICYVQTRLDRETDAYLSDLWLVPSAGMAGEAVQFTHGPRTVAQPRWSPNGRWLAFLADRADKGRKQLWIIPTSGVGGEARELTSSDSAVSDFVWAAPGSPSSAARSTRRATPAPSRPTTPSPRAGGSPTMW